MRLMLAALVGVTMLTACAIAPPYPWVEVKVTARYLDEMTMQELIRAKGIRQQADGFHENGVIYCLYEESRRAFLICGHELWHAVRGGFH